MSFVFKLFGHLQSIARTFPRAALMVLGIAVAAVIIGVPAIRQALAPSPLDYPAPVPVYPQAQVTPSSLRKSVVDMTAAEKIAFVNAVKRLHQIRPEGSDLSRYEQFVLQHVLTMGFDHNPDSTGPQKVNPAHGRAAFLPWHRQFLLQFEQALQAIDPTVTVPYWDWTDPDALEVVLQADFLGPNGRGTWVEIPGGGQFEGGPVTTGSFADWRLNEALHFEAYSGKTFGDRLLRFVGLPPFDQYPLETDTDALLSLDHYEVFNALLEGAAALNSRGQFVPGWNFHAYIHTLIGGSEIEVIESQDVPKEIRTLGTMESIPCSPYDPIFWLLHANVDRLWAQWQDQGHTGESFFPNRGNPFGHNLKDPMFPWDGGLSKPGSFGPGNLLVWLPTVATAQVVTPADVLDFRSLGYTYDTTRSSVYDYHNP